MAFSVAGLARDPAPEQRDRIALVAGDRQLTYGDLDGRASRFGAGLQRAGLLPGDRVLLLLRNAVELVEALLGSVRAGAVPVPLNWRLSAEELHAVARDAAPTAVVVARDLQHLLPPLEGVALTVVDDAYDAWLMGQPALDPGVRPAPSDVVLQLYTSGTSGLPKGVLLTDGNFAARIPHVMGSWRFEPGSTSLVATPLFHTGGIGWLLTGLHAGATQILAASATPEALLSHLREDAVSHVFLVPTMIQRLCDAAPAGSTFPALRTILYGASPISEQTMAAAQALFGDVLVQAYGMTETTGGFAQLEPQDHHGRLLASAGRPYPWVEVAIHDPETGARLPDEAAGEIWTRSAQNSPGYHRRPAETAALLPGDGWLRTGDGGYVDPDGYLFLTDRVKDMIVTGGENVYPAEVERVLREHPAVADAAVVGLPDPQWGERVAAAVVERPGHHLDVEELLAFVGARIAGYKRPRSVHVLPDLPRNATGKVLKRAVRTALTQEAHR